MNYDEVVEVFFQPPPSTDPPPAIVGASPARRLRDAVEPLAMHPVWCRPTNEALAVLGFRFLPAYVWGRAAALGLPEPGVVAAAFAVFEPAMIAGLYAEGRAVCDREQLLRIRSDATSGSLRTVLGDDCEAAVGRVADQLVAAVAAQPVAGRPLFAGVVAQPWPQDAFGRLWRACEAVREHRGDSHVAACVGAGLDPVAMNVLTELWLDQPAGPYTATRGWSAEQIAAAVDGLQARGWVAAGSLTDAGRALRTQIEENTDAAQYGILAALGDDVESIIEQTTAWSARCIEAKAFPPDPAKRAAG